MPNRSNPVLQIRKFFLRINQKGIAPVVIITVAVVLIILGLGFHKFWFQTKPEEGILVSSPQPTPTVTASPGASMAPGIVKTGTKPLLTPSPTPSGSPSPTGKPVPKEGVYNLSPNPEQNFTLKASPQSGHQMYAVLQDSNNDVIKNQSKIKFEWSIDNADLVDMQSGGWGGPGNCSYGITESDPCPKMFATVTTKGVTGKATVTAKAFDEYGKKIGETSFNITVE